MSDPGPTTPHVRFSQRTLPNGMRIIVAPDRLAPVVAINLWYDVGSKHEVAGKTGFAHLFEHFMFQGSRHVAKAEHMAMVQGAGGIVELTFARDPTGIRVAIVDPGIPFDPWSALQTMDRPDRGGGVGIEIIRAWAEFISYHSTTEGNRLEFLEAAE